MSKQTATQQRQEKFREALGGSYDPQEGKLEFNYGVYEVWSKTLIAERTGVVAHRCCFSLHTEHIDAVRLEITDENWTEEDAECVLCGR